MSKAYNSSRCCVLVVSCDAYQDLWSPFFDAFFRNWPDCPFRIYLVANVATMDDSRIQTIRTGPDVSWSTNLKAALSQVPEEFVLLILEDLFLTREVNTAAVERLMEWSIENGACCTKMTPYPPPDRPENKAVGKVSPGALYRVSTVLTFWKREVLDALLVRGESAWEFEISGSVRSDSFDRFYAAHDKNFTFMNGVIRGKWRPEVIRRLKRIGIHPNTAARPILSSFERVRLRLLYLRFAALQMLPAGWRRRIRDLFTGRERGLAASQSKIDS